VEAVLKNRWVVLTLRIVLSAAMLAVLLWRVPDFEASELMPDWRPASAVWLTLAILLTVASIALSAVRWQQVLHALDLPTPLKPLLSIYFAGQFVANVLPTTIGGDVVRVARLQRRNKEPAKTVASVVLERLTGWLVLPVMSLIGFIINRGLLPDNGAKTAALVINTFALCGLVLVLWLASHPKALGRLAEQKNWLGFLGSVHLGVVYLRKHPDDAAKVLLAGVVFQFTLVLAAFCAARVIGIDEAGLTAMLAFIPVVLMVQVLPIGISGLGLRETSLLLFLSPLGVPHEQAIALGLALYLLNLVASLLGAPAFALGGRKDLEGEGDGEHVDPLDDAELALEGVDAMAHLLEKGRDTRPETDDGAVPVR
jgi:uncharacterized membrane protein YbhN (UPF0104 family)